MSGNQFALDIAAIRDDARRHMAGLGAVTAADPGDDDRIIDVLNTVVATEIVCVMRYTQSSISASEIDRAQVASLFIDHAGQEMRHGIRAAERVSQLGGEADFEPATLVERSSTTYSAPEPTDLATMLRENLFAERMVITTYQEIIRWLGDRDPTTRRILESILEEEEAHAEDLNNLLDN